MCVYAHLSIHPYVKFKLSCTAPIFKYISPHTPQTHRHRHRCAHAHTHTHTHTHTFYYTNKVHIQYHTLSCSYIVIACSYLSAYIHEYTHFEWYIKKCGFLYESQQQKQNTHNDFSNVIRWMMDCHVSPVTRGISWVMIESLILNSFFQIYRSLLSKQVASKDNYATYVYQVVHRVVTDGLFIALLQYNSTSHDQVQHHTHVIRVWHACHTLNKCVATHEICVCICNLLVYICM